MVGGCRRQHLQPDRELVGGGGGLGLAGLLEAPAEIVVDGCTVARSGGYSWRRSAPNEDTICQLVGSAPALAGSKARTLSKAAAAAG